MGKFITFVLDSFDLEDYKVSQFSTTTFCHSYIDTKSAIEKNCEDIWTYDLSHLSFDLIDNGYTIIIANKGIYLTCYPGMNSLGNKDIRKGHNLLKLLLGGYFNDDLKL